MTCSRKIISEIKVIAKIQGIQANNALTLDPLTGVLQFGGPLIHDTVVNGNYNLSFGSFGNNIKYFSVSSGTTVYLEANNGSVGSFVNIDNNVILVGSSAPASRGLHGLHNYSANYQDFTYVQKVYTDNHIVGKNARNDVTSPGPTEDQKMIAWNNATGEWIMRTGSGAVTIGNPTEVIYNQAGTLVGHPNFTFNVATSVMSVPLIDMGHDFLAGDARYLTMRSSDPNVTLYVYLKGAGNFHIGTFNGAILLGSPAATDLLQRIQARGSQPQVDIALEPKGPDGMVFIGDKDEIGAFKRLAARGYNAHIHLMLQSKGQGNVILDPDPDNSVDGAWVKIGQGSGTVPGIRTRRLYADSEWVTTNLEIGGTGAGFTLLVGTSNQNVSDRFMTVASAAPDCNLQVYGKGLGKAAVNNIVRSKKVNIGDWNMSSSPNKNVTHGLPNHRKIISVEVIIRNDVDTFNYPLDSRNLSTPAVPNGGVIYWDSSYVWLGRLAGGDFANINFDATGYNRGWIYINYEL
jgi:hypothetical protein